MRHIKLGRFDPIGEDAYISGDFWTPRDEDHRASEKDRELTDFCMDTGGLREAAMTVLLGPRFGPEGCKHPREFQKECECTQCGLYSKTITVLVHNNTQVELEILVTRQPFSKTYTASSYPVFVSMDSEDKAVEKLLEIKMESSAKKDGIGETEITKPRLSREDQIRIKIDLMREASVSSTEIVKAFQAATVV